MRDISISSIRRAAPTQASGEITRQRLIDTILASQKQLTYIHAGAGYGKTTLLAQVAAVIENTVWLSLDGESDVFTFVDSLSEAIKRCFPDFDFTASEYLPFDRKDEFTKLLANALVCSIEQLASELTIILDDLHTIADPQIKQLIICIIKCKPDQIRIYLSSRESPWAEFLAWQLRGQMLELTRTELDFTRDEVVQVLGFDDINLYQITEGWPLAVNFFRLLLEDGVSLVDVPTKGHEALSKYLFHEYISRLPYKTVSFLQSTSCFEELDAPMLDAVLEIKMAKQILDDLVERNIFTVKTRDGQYRYHALFRSCLSETAKCSPRLLFNKATSYYYEQGQYSKAAQYAILCDNKELLQKIIVRSYRDYMGKGKFSELRVWFQALGNNVEIDPDVLVAKGAFLSSIGNFSEAQKCLDVVVPMLDTKKQKLYIEAMIHKARVIRNSMSFDESNRVLNELLLKIDKFDFLLSYPVVIEKIYNLCWNSQIKEAYDVTYDMIESCFKQGELRIKTWYERYLTTINFFAGRMKDAVYYYEKSLELPDCEREYLDMHSIGMYAAKAYQMLGEREKAVSIISWELQRLKSTGRYEEMWAAYLLAAEIHYQNTFMDRMNGGSQTYEEAARYFSLADEFAPLCRTSDFQMHWSKMQRLVTNLVSSQGPKDSIIKEILSNLDRSSDFLKTIVLGRLFSYYSVISDFPSVVRYAKLAIDIGERAGIMMIATIAYGILAKAAIATNDFDNAIKLTTRYIQLCSENGILEYFKLRKTYGSVLQFAFDHGIEPDFTNLRTVKLN